MENCETTVVGELVRLLPVLLGGFLGISGTILSQYCTHWFSGRREHKKLMREKAEEMLQGLYEHRDWYDAQRNAMLFRNVDFDVPSPLDRVHAIQYLYFPELTQAIKVLNQRFMDLQSSLYEQKERQLKDKKQWLESNSVKELSPYYKAYLEAWGDVVDEMLTTTSKYII